MPGTEIQTTEKEKDRQYPTASTQRAGEAQDGHIFIWTRMRDGNYVQGNSETRFFRSWVLERSGCVMRGAATGTSWSVSWFIEVVRRLPVFDDDSKHVLSRAELSGPSGVDHFKLPAKRNWNDQRAVQRDAGDGNLARLTSKFQISGFMLIRTDPLGADRFTLLLLLLVLLLGRNLND